MTYTGESSVSSNWIMSSPLIYSFQPHPALAWRSRSARGSSPPVSLRNVSSVSRASESRLLGTCTFTVTRRSPIVESERLTPLPGIRNVRPFGVPAGMRKLTGIPRCDGTLISAPSASSANVTGTVTVRLWPDRPNTGCGATCTRTYRSPAGPPRSPGAPLPLSLIRWPSPTPAGMRAWMVLVLIARPLPEQVGHGSSTTRPRPRHDLQGSENAKLPRFRLACPVPSQVGHTRGTVPALAPVPLQVWHGPSPARCKDTVAPSMESPKLSDASVSTSAPRLGLVWVVVRPPNMPPSRSPSRPPAPPPVPPGALPNRSPRSKL